MKITKRQLRRIIRESINDKFTIGKADSRGTDHLFPDNFEQPRSSQDLSKPIPIDDLKFVDEEGYGAMMFPGPGHSYSVREKDFEAAKAKLKQRYGDDAMISIPDPRYPKVKKIHSAKFDKAQSKENQNFMRHQAMMRNRLGKEPSLGS